MPGYSRAKVEKVAGGAVDQARYVACQLTDDSEMILLKASSRRATLENRQDCRREEKFSLGESARETPQTNSPDRPSQSRAVPPKPSSASPS